MAGRGRPPDPRAVQSFEASDHVPPASVLLDTSFVVEALMSGQTHHAACAQALVDLAWAGSSITYSSLLELELIEAGYQVALRDRYGGGWRQARSDGRARRRASRLAERALEAWSEAAQALDARRIDASTVAPAVPELMRAHALRSYDAVHVATAFEAGVHHALALDTGFARVPAEKLELLTVSSKVGSMRAIRASRAA